MKQIILARYGEIHLKGANKGLFLNRLLSNLRRRLPDTKIHHDDNRIIIETTGDQRYPLQVTTNTFGIVSASVAVVLDSTPESILNYLKKIKINGSFKVEVNRADKRFPHKSPEFARTCGGMILDNNKELNVDLHNPGTTVCIDIRSSATYVYTEVIEGVGGLPVGVSGRAIVMLSGGIDSPVAAWLAQKRGLSTDFIHFETPPYTNELAMDKVKKLAGIVGGRLFVVPFTEISLAIRKTCAPELMITIMRRFMVRIAERLGLDNKLDCIITGENLAQVASQTIAGITSNNFCATELPILRPLVTYDKSEIIALAKKIGTYETSIIPHEDCCSIFVPRNPAINPKLEFVIREESKLDVTALVERAVKEVNTM